ncbi:LamG-like jellyroll fold domain-containing protein [Agromyces salentinus]|uniref:PKD domain-containing protein n=1 Tax=Agromyces salentinus TaxID=269421 RepID=A0ABP4YXH3_9MICO|nr:LamG-like jellyroll fold domain-containing protein [Agromyces salentinus]
MRLRFPTAAAATAWVAATLVLASMLVAAPAQADTAPEPGLPATVSSDSLPTAQINGVVWDQAIVGDTVFVGGNFTAARPAGSPPGSNTVARTHLLSYRLSTGQLLSWAPNLNGQVRAMDTSPDGSRLYVVGAFTTVNGGSRSRIAAFDTASGSLITDFNASANGELFAVGASASTVYFAGNLSSAGGLSRPGRAAAATATTGATTGWAPVLADGRAYALEVSPDASKVVLGGSFLTANGSSNPGFGLVGVNTTTGASIPTPANNIIRNAGNSAAIYGMSSDADSVYGSGYVLLSSSGTGNTEGTFRIDWATLNLIWMADCRGDQYGSAAQGDVVYIAGHPHQCEWVGDFPEHDPQSFQRALAFTKAPFSVVRENINYGKPSTRPLAFYPDMNLGNFTGQYQGPWTVQANAQYVAYAGEFTQVNGIGQQGLSRFAVSSIAPDADGPRASGGGWPLSAVPIASGAVRVSWPANHDRDNERLVYQVVRNGSTIATIPGRSRFWDRPTMTYVDTGLSPGAPASYRVNATDPFGNVAWSQTASTSAGSSGSLSDYARAVFADSPTWYFRMGDPTGSTLANAAGPTAAVTRTLGATAQVDAASGSGVTEGVPGAVPGDSNTAARFNGTANGRAATAIEMWPDDSMSVEAWFKTTVSSGKILGQGDNGSATGTSSSHNRSLYLNGGRVSWTVFDTQNRTLQSGTGYNDGAWHHAVATLGPDGMRLYVDGQQVSTFAPTNYGRNFYGYWKIGGDATPGGNQNFTGDLDELAIYKTVLPASRVAAHWQARSGGGGPGPNQPPSASFSTSVDGMAVGVDANGSSDADGGITSRHWDFGDGTTGSGILASRTYAVPGTYTITLTVTDDDGAQASTSRQVAVDDGTDPPVGPVGLDDFSRTLSNGWGAATTGGTWAVNDAPGFLVGSGVGATVFQPGLTRRATLPITPSASMDVSVTLSIEKTAAGGAAAAGAVVRQVGSAFYQGRIRFLTNGTCQLQLNEGSGTVLANLDPVAGLSCAAGQRIRLRVQATGTSPTTLRVRAWQAGSPEPASWQLTATSTSGPLQAAGIVGVEGYVSGATTNAPNSILFDDFAASILP